MNKQNRVVLLLAAYDFESLHLALTALQETLDEDEQVVIVLNGKRGLRSTYVEDVAREWCAGHPSRHVVKPPNYGREPYGSLTQVIEGFAVLQKAEFICKIDDDLVPLKKGWVDNLHRSYLDLEKRYSKIGFVTSLINNNSWGFKRLIDIFNRQEEYRSIMNMDSVSAEGIMKPGEVAAGFKGTVWEYPYLARWVHQWTLCSIDNYINKTKDLGVEEIDLNLHYSIGCIFFRRSLWTALEAVSFETDFDELLIHKYCLRQRLRKFAVMNEPMGHLFYHVQRVPNRSQLPRIRQSLAAHWSQPAFMKVFAFDTTTTVEIAFEGYLSDNSNRLDSVIRDLEIVHKSSFYYKMRTQYRSAKKAINKFWPASAADKKRKNGYSSSVLNSSSGKMEASKLAAINVSNQPSPLI